MSYVKTYFKDSQKKLLGMQKTSVDKMPETKCCKRCKQNLPADRKTFQVNKLNKKTGLGNVCSKCRLSQLRSDLKPNGTKKRRRLTKTDQKKKAFKRDKGCIAPWSKSQGTQAPYDFDHAYTKHNEQIPNELDPNDYRLGVTVTREVHDLAKKDQDWHYYRQIYLWRKHKLIPLTIPDELAKTIWEKFQGMKEGYKKEESLYLAWKGKTSSLNQP